MGNKQNAKFFRHYSLWGSHSLENGSLDRAGFHRDDITDVFLTHLHFDHCGGAIENSDPNQGVLQPAFKNAFLLGTRGALGLGDPIPILREKASFLKENILPLQESGQLKFIEGEGPLLTQNPLPFSVLLVSGHTEKQMLPVIEYRGKRIVFAADLIPTVGHLPIPYVMGYDTRPLLTLKEKSPFLEDAFQKETLLFLEHDPYHELISLKQTEKGIRMDDHYQLDSYFS